MTAELDDRRSPARGRGVLAWYDGHRSGRTVIGLWWATRLAILVVLATVERFVVGDVFYYWRKIAGLGAAGLPGTLNEYPTPVVWLLSLPYGLAVGSRVGYLIAFVALMMALDALFTWALWRSAGRRHTSAIDFWLVFVLAIGPLSYLRFDLIPAVLAGGALLAARRRPWMAGALTGLGAALKLWPALLIPALAVLKPGRRRAAWGFVVVGFGLAAISLGFGGWTRLVSPLTWQSGRGLQIESVWATPIMIARALQPQRWTVDMSRFQAFEVFGPGIGPWLTISNVATVVGLAVIVALWVRAYRQPEVTIMAIGLIMLATIAIMTVTNKTLSPQYLLWLGGPAAGLLLLARSGAERRTTVRVALQLGALAVLTHLVYPLLYDGLLGRQGGAMLVASTVVTAVRNLALVAFTVEICRLAWQALRPAPTP